MSIGYIHLLSMVWTRHSRRASARTVTRFRCPWAPSYFSSDHDTGRVGVMLGRAQYNGCFFQAT